jgi:hypothetical protein
MRPASFERMTEPSETPEPNVTDRTGEPPSGSVSISSRDEVKAILSAEAASRAPT